MPDRGDSPEPMEEAPSKSERKRRMLALQALGEALVNLGEKQLATIPIADTRLLDAIRECRGIRSNSARKRQLQYIGKLMRDTDPWPIEAALQDLDRHHRKKNDAFHQVEAMRDTLLREGVPGIEAILAHWPGADRQQLRQLLLKHEREVRDGKPPAASRKLFSYLRELSEKDSGQA